MEAEMFGHYRLEELIGRGGMGEVHRATDTRRGRVVALKRLPAHLAGDAQFRARFSKEAALASRLSEPHIVPIHDFGEIDGRLYLDMRLVSGRELGSAIKAEGALTPDRATAIVAQIASALDAAHADGLIHRDVKPSNVLISDDRGRDFVHLVDFGIARSMAAGAGTSLTVTGATVGTLDYMAPERFEDKGYDHRIDVYSLACLLYECLTGHRPFRSETVPGLIHAHLQLDPPRPSRARPGIPVALDAVVARGMAKDPNQRYASAGALADAATAAAAGLPSRGFGPPSPAVTVRSRTPARTPPPDPGGSPPLPVTRYAPPPRGGFAPPPPLPPQRRRRRRWPVVVAVMTAAAAVVIGVTVAVPVLAGGSGGSPATTTAAPPPTSDTPTSSAPDPTAAPTADQAGLNQSLYDATVAQGITKDSCAFSDDRGSALASMECDSVDPELAYKVLLDRYGSSTGASDALTDVSGTLSGDPGFCDGGGRAVETRGDYDLACGYVVKDGTTYYRIAWTRRTTSIVGWATDSDPATAWKWWSSNNPF